MEFEQLGEICPQGIYNPDAGKILMDTFSLEDRKALIKQEIILQNIVDELVTIKNNLLTDHDKRLQSLEDDRIRVSTQIKTIIFLGGFIITVVQIIVEVSLHIVLK